MNGLSRLPATLLLLVILVGCAPATTPTPPPSGECEGDRIVIGEIGDDRTTIRESVQGLADYLAKRLAPYGIACGRVEVLANTDQMADALKKGDVDIYFDSLYPATLVSQETGAQPVLRRWRNCDPEYLSVIIARRDSGIQTIQDLPGHMIGMDHAQSTSGFAVAAAHLLDQGLNLAVKESVANPVDEGEVGIVFTYGDENTLTAINQDAIKAGVTDDYFFYNLLDLQSQEALTVLWKSEPIIRQVVLLAPDLSDDLQAAIKAELIAAENVQAGRAAIEQAGQTCKFDEPPEGQAALTAQMQEIYDKVKAISGLPYAGP